MGKQTQKMCECLFKGKQDEILHFAKLAAAQKKSVFDRMSKQGRAGALARKATDKLRNTIIAEVNKLKRERDANYPDRDNGGEKGLSNNRIYQAVANKHIGANGKPIYTPSQIKEWYKPSKIRRCGGHKRK